MPTYQYACTDPACDHRFEQFQSFTDAALTDCPVCSGRLRKVYGSVGVVFKGSGFYRNDSRAETNGAKNKKNGEAAKDASSTSASSSSSDSSSSASESSSSKDAASGKESSGSSSSSTSDSSSSSSSSASPAKAPARSGSSTTGSSGSRRS
ncbi:MAG: FmdB family transcriptional regulator [Actinomycetota bacterium]|nr:FmdB family transcriptional regulator [Actinomycetota bacterium]